MKIIIQCGIQINDEYWFAAGNTNGLFKKNLLTGELIFIDFFPNEEKTQFRAYTDVKLIGNKLIFTPCFAKRVAIYDLDENKFSDIALPNYESGINQYIKSVKYKDCIYFIPFSSSSFIKYCGEESDIVRLYEWTNLKKQYLNEKDSNLIIETCCSDNNNIYMFMSNRNQAIILNMNTDQFRIESLNVPFDETVCCVCKYSDNIWIATNKNKIYKWDYTNNEIVQQINLNQFADGLEFRAHYINVTNRYIYLLNVYDKNIRAFDYINSKFTIIDMSKHVNDKKDDNVSLYYYYDVQGIENNKMRLFSYYDGKYITIEGIQVIDSFSGFGLPKDYLEKVIREKFFTNQLFYERYTLRSFASSLSEEMGIILLQSGLINKDKKYYRKNVGELIYNALMQGEAW